MTPHNKDLRTTIKSSLVSHNGGTVTILSSLLAIEDSIGYIPSEAIEEVADFTNSTINDVWGVASFYTNFRFTPPGEHVVEVCWGPSCHILGAQRIIKEVLETLGLNSEGDTEDGKFTFKYNTCLAACGQAPVISVDNQLMGRMTAEKAKERIARLRSAVNGDKGST